MRRPPWIALIALVGCEDPPPPPPPPTILEVVVLDAASEAPVQEAWVLLRDSNGKVLDARTDAGGLATWTDPPAPPYQLFIQAARHVPRPRLGEEPARLAPAPNVTTRYTHHLEPRPRVPGQGVLRGRLTRAGQGQPLALVVAQGTDSGASWTNERGEFEVRGLGPGLYQVSAFVRGFVSSVRGNVQLGVDQTLEGLDLQLDPVAGRPVGGRLIGGTGTSSVVLVHPAVGLPITGATGRFPLGASYLFEEVPPGTYQVVAGLEDDGVTYAAQWALDRAPLEVTVSETASATLDLELAPALAGARPGGGEVVAGTPRFTWPEVQGADFYVLELADLSGLVVWGGFDARKNPRSPVLAPRTSVDYDGPALSPGQLYRWRVYAAEDVTTGQIFRLLQASEVLGGEFRVRRQ